ncbi:MAG TPA: hypothetical protein VKE74_06765 [Gemmataceae bacterium]|nr:hypothetical protein [Gemmataceae bacterium]
MPSWSRPCQLGIPALLVCGILGLAGRASGQDAVTLAESFQPGRAYRVDVQVKLTGRLAVPLEKGKPPQVVTLSGESRLLYDERILAPDEANTLKAVRAYREVEFKRTLGQAPQEASIRASVRRMVVMKAGPRKAPFSPDGPLTWGEIDVVRTDVFNPAAIPGLLPSGPVKPGQSWKATDDAVLEITDMEKVEEGSLAVEFVGLTMLNNRKVARLRVSGSVRGVNEDGPNRQKLEGTAYFDLDAGTLVYLSLKGTHELLDGSGQTAGVIDGQFTLKRSPLAQPPPDLADASLAGLVLKPTPENTLLLYDNPDLGVRFLYPRGWRVGAVQGKQVTLDHARFGGGILITVEPAAKVPSADEYAREITTFLRKEKAEVTASEPPTRVRAEPVQLDRFRMDAAFGSEKVRLEYAVLKQSDGGATVAARLPAEKAAELQGDIERIIRSLAVTKRIEEKK